MLALQVSPPHAGVSIPDDNTDFRSQKLGKHLDEVSTNYRTTALVGRAISSSETSAVPAA